MKKFLAILFVSFAQISAGFLVAETPRPAWVQNPPGNTANMVYFLGISDRAANYENFLEAKAGALADVLFQFSVYKDVEFQGKITDSINDQTEEYALESLTRLISQNDSSGLYQQAEWMDRDGTLYVLYGYSPGGILNPRPNLSDAFERITFSSGRIYFAALAVSSQDNAELARQAEQNARIQVQLWFGTDINMDLREYYEQLDNQVPVEFFSGAIIGRSGINFQPLVFREESRRVVRGQDNRFYHYGIYSISDARPAIIAESEVFSYSVAYESRTESFEKQININGNRFTRERPYPARTAGDAPSEFPAPVVNVLFNSPENTLLGLGIANNASMETQRLMAGIRAVSEIGLSASSAILDGTIFSRMILSRLEISLDFLAPDNTTWQVWAAGQ